MRSAAFPTLVLLTIGLLSGLGGCDRSKPAAPRGTTQPNASQPSTAPAARSDEDEVVGVWEAVVGDVKRGEPLIARMTLNVVKGGTFTLINEMPEPGSSGKAIVNRSEGRWAIEDGGEYLALKLERSSTGREIPADQRQLKLRIASDTPGKSVTVLEMDPPDGPTFRPKRPE